MSTGPSEEAIAEYDEHAQAHGRRTTAEIAALFEETDEPAPPTN